ncbi:MAG: ribosome silencing factor [Balneolaceae bacterium]
MPIQSDTASDQFTSLTTEKTADSEALIKTITDALLEKKAKEIVLLDVRGLTTLTDYFIVCHGTSETQIKALANSVLDKTSEKIGEKAWKREGLDARRWIILDYVNVVVHIFNEEKRNFYGIERMWNDAVRTEIKDEE